MCFCVALIIILTCSFVSVRVATALCRAPVSLPLSPSPSRSLSHSLAFFIAVVLASHSARAKNVINLMISIKCSPVQGRSGLVEVRPEGSRECKVAMGMGDGRGSGGCAENGFAFAHATALLGQLK